MDKKAKVKKLLSKKATRIALCERSFFYFVLYYFSGSITYPSADFHKEYCKSLQSGKSILFNGFRESGKTVLAKYYLTWCICYKKKKYIIFFCDEKKKAVDKIIDVAGYLQANKRIIEDFGKLFVEDIKTDKSTKKRMGDFETTNSIRVEAMGMGETIRGKVFGEPGGGEHRPDLVFMDDVDTKKSVNTELLIDKGYQYVKNDIFGAMNDEGQMVFLYNTIRKDGVGPRLREDHSDRDRYAVPIIGADMKEDSISRPQRYTIDDIMKKKKESGEIAFNQNYLLIPYIGGQSIIRRERIQHGDGLAEYDQIVIGCDPAISKSTYSDDFAIVVSGHKGDKKYILESIALQGDSKSSDNSCKIITNIYNRHNCKSKVVVFETNGFQRVMRDQLRKSGIATKEHKVSKDKISRLSEWQYAFESGQVTFVGEHTQLIDQLLTFPNGKHDDMVDGMMHSFVKRNFIAFSI